jgi:hypothetical protein
VRRCLIVLTAAAAWHPVAATALFALLRRRPALVAHASAPMVQLVIDQAPDDIAAAVDSALPRYCGLPLLWPAGCTTHCPPPLSQPNGPTAWKTSACGCQCWPVGGRRDGHHRSRRALPPAGR